MIVYYVTKSKKSKFGNIEAVLCNKCESSILHGLRFIEAQLHSTEKVIENIEQRGFEYRVAVVEPSTKVVVKSFLHEGKTRKYITTERDGRLANNLDRLPDV